MSFSLFHHARDSQPASSVEATPAGAAELIVYGTAWCGDCHRSRRFLERNQVPFRWIDLDRHPDAVERVLAINHGQRSVPTIVFPDGSTLTEPSNAELGHKLGIG